jgi:N6-adenosine-specific RNA methylase IME4
MSRNDAAAPLPAGPFDVIVADPPWSEEFGHSCSRSITRHYATMTLADICSMPVGHMAADDALLLLWVPANRLHLGLDVMAAWGFTFRTSGCWVKPRAGTGKWLRSQHELYLLGRRGRFPAPLAGTLRSSVIEASAGRHSEKPDDLHRLVETTWPGLRYVELFARRPRRGWVAWGNDPAVAA